MSSYTFPTKQRWRRPRRLPPKLSLAPMVNRMPANRPSARVSPGRSRCRGSHRLRVSTTILSPLPVPRLPPQSFRGRKAVGAPAVVVGGAPRGASREGAGRRLVGEMDRADWTGTRQTVAEMYRPLEFACTRSWPTAQLEKAGKAMQVTAQK